MSRLAILFLRLIGYGLLALIVSGIVLYTTNLMDFRTRIDDAYARLQEDKPLTADDILLEVNELESQHSS